ncbi:hypothetical protein F5I97DRAFT_370510 [Phlebopus sp. FC_14]|nr:hypothetical protein F5I97DRAFT_370510 [Phlebopus sp. FC_14]
MGPPRRTRSNSSVSNHNATQNRPRHPSAHPHQPHAPFPPPAHTNPPPPPPPQQQQQGHSQLGMSPASRYNSNLKVVRRRDPSIVSIFDQFSHVCVYHHNGDKWEKQGYEGSMFLYERDSYPPYGIYIMNRVGMEDYIQRLYPEDSIGAHGSYLMMRQYPDFTARRLSEVRSKLPLSKQDGPVTKFASEFALVYPEKLQDADKGLSQTVGLWCLATDSRESMTDVLMRLHGCIKKNMPYPDEFRYGPDRPPPPNYRSLSRASERAHVRSTSSASNTSSITSISESGEEDVPPAPSAPTPANAHNVSELDKLFAKLGGTTSKGPSQSTGSSETAAASLLADMYPSRTMSVPPPSTVSTTPARGLALLDTIFASATPPPARPLSRGDRSSNLSHHAQINHSSSCSSVPSEPSTTYHPLAYTQDSHILSPKPTSTALPQVLNQEVISTLLGLPPSRASSVRYEGDNEASDDGTSEPGSMAASIPELYVPCDPLGGSAINSNGRILGDVTPRPALRGFGSDINQVSDLLATTHTERQRDYDPSQRVHLPIPSSKSSSVVDKPADSSIQPNGTHKLPKPRQLIPFETDSELWPYPRAPIVETDSDVIELDFSDMSALSDPNAFEKRIKGRKQKKSKKDQQRERDEIEQSWDVPTPLRAVSSPPPMLNGKAKTPPHESHTNSQCSSSTNSAKVDINGVQSSLLTTLATQHNNRLRDLSRKDFVSEVLTLIYTDKQFVDNLWRQYTSHAS